MKPAFAKSFVFSALLMCSVMLHAQTLTYPVVGTNVQTFYGATGIISTPNPGDAFYGQDANYPGTSPSYTDNGDGTVTDNVTGLMWQKSMGSQITFPDALIKADTMTLGGYTDWRVPTIKELYSLILFTGKEGTANDSSGYIKYIDTQYFIQPFGNTAIGDRLIDAQTWSCTQYRGLTMGGDSTVFGVNFIDGRIKGYPKYVPMTTNLKVAYFRMVRGNPQYGLNNFTDNGDGTISDAATGLMWQQSDDSTARDWENALSYAENLDFAGYNDWRLPNAKELQSIVDYTRCPQITSSPAINPLFLCTEINDPNGNAGQYPYYWSSTTHLTGPVTGDHAAYLAFGKAQGKMSGTLMDVHGAGSQRSDPKSGNAANYPAYFGPQGDVQYVYNYVRCVRNIGTEGINEHSIRENKLIISPNPATDKICITLPAAQQAEIRIYNSTGTIVRTLSSEGNEKVVVDISDLSSGLYLVRSIQASGTGSGLVIKSR
jgi:hypothetical protein